MLSAACRFAPPRSSLVRHFSSNLPNWIQSVLRGNLNSTYQFDRLGLQNQFDYNLSLPMPLKRLELVEAFKYCNFLGAKTSPRVISVGTGLFPNKTHDLLSPELSDYLVLSVKNGLRLPEIVCIENDVKIAKSLSVSNRFMLLVDSGALERLGAPKSFIDHYMSYFETALSLTKPCDRSISSFISDLSFLPVPEPEQLIVVRELKADFTPKTEVLAADILSCKLPDSKVDLIVANRVLHYAFFNEMVSSSNRDCLSTLTNLVKGLRFGGVLVLDTDSLTVSTNSKMSFQEHVLSTHLQQTESEITSRLNTLSELLSEKGLLIETKIAGQQLEGKTVNMVFLKRV